MLLPAPPADVVSVSTVRFYSDEARTTLAAERPVVTNTDGTLSVDTSTVPAGRYYFTVVGLDSGGVETTYVLSSQPYVDLPEDDTLLLSPEALAVRAGIALPLSEADRDTIRDAILDAQSDVVAYLGRPIFPIERTEYHLWPHDEGWHFTDLDYDPLIEVVSVTAEVVDGQVTGYFTVTYWAGIDARLPEYRPIYRYVVAHALNGEDFLALWRTRTAAKGAVKSLSAEGQSVSFEKANLGRTDAARPGDNAPGSLPTLSSLDRWRVAGRRVHQPESRVTDWPFTGARW